jgi:6-phosphogluconate dehydrogenase (decarboxylating)
MKTKVTLIGAGGKMGCRLSDNLKNSAYEMSYVEISPAGLERLAQRDITATFSRCRQCRRQTWLF